MHIALLVLIELDPGALERLRAQGFEPRLAHGRPAVEAAIERDGPAIRAVLTNGSTGLSADDIQRLPGLEIICAQGAGYEKVDLAVARARGIVVTHGPGTNDATVADHAMALLLGIARGIPQADGAVRRGQWLMSRQPRPMVSGKHLGILGLGQIGRQIAQRGALGFNMRVSYHNRQPLADVPYGYASSVLALAAEVDFLVIATPGGAGTRHLVSAQVLHALGPQGFLINIARGSVVDTQALIAALAEGRLAGAALDVLDGEPEVPTALAQMSNVILTPHIAGRSPEAVAATSQRVLDNLTAHFSGQSPVTPVPTQ